MSTETDYVRKGVLIAIITIPIVFFSIIATQITDEEIDMFDNGSAVNQNVDYLDDDNDGIINVIDAFPQNSEEWDDFDFDGIGANEDTDDDNDGILDIDDPLPSPISTKLTMKYNDLVENCAEMDSELEQQLCYRNFFVTLIDKGEQSAEIINMAFYYTKLDITDSCHPIAHHVGHYSFVKNPNLSENMLQGENLCRNGFYHGILAAYFGDLKTEEIEISSSHIAICDEFIGTDILFDCIHGLGHGLVVYYYDDLIPAVDACNDLKGDLSTVCKFGAMMEFNEHKLTETFNLTKEISDICSIDELTDEDRTVCYLKMGQLLGFLTKHDVAKGNEYCLLLDPPFNEYCAIALLEEFERYEKEQTLLIPFN